MDWFRWHHGSVTDPKFQLVAKKSGATVAEVIAVWACLLEAASMAEDRGNSGACDFEAMDCALGLAEGTAQAIHRHMEARDLIEASGRIVAWDKRQPKREREDDTAAERKRRQRERESGSQVTPGHATSHQKTPRGEEIREEEIPPNPLKGDLPGFTRFWETWPKSDRKQARGKCHDAWKKAGAEPSAALIVAHVERMRAGPWQRDGGQFIPAPLTYLNQRRWEGADDAGNDDPYGLKGSL